MILQIFGIITILIIQWSFSQQQVKALHGMVMDII